LQAVIGDDPLDAAQANLELGLAKLLGDHGGRGVWIQKAVAQDLALGLIGAAVIGFGAGLLRLQGAQATGLVVPQELVVARPAKAVLVGEVANMAPQTLAFQEHEEAMSQLVGGGHRQFADGADQLESFGIEVQRRIHAGTIAELGRRV
jgi:hypothetical protein